MPCPSQIARPPCFSRFHISYSSSSSVCHPLPVDLSKKHQHPPIPSHENTTTSGHEHILRRHHIKLPYFPTKKSIASDRQLPSRSVSTKSLTGKGIRNHGRADAPPSCVPSRERWWTPRDAISRPGPCWRHQGFGDKLRWLRNRCVVDPSQCYRPQYVQHKRCYYFVQVRDYPMVNAQQQSCCNPRVLVYDAFSGEHSSHPGEALLVGGVTPGRKMCRRSCTRKVEMEPSVIPQCHWAYVVNVGVDV